MFAKILNQCLAWGRGALRLSCLWVNVDLEYWTQDHGPRVIVLGWYVPTGPLTTCSCSLPPRSLFFEGIYSDLSLCFWAPGSDLPRQPVAALPSLSAVPYNVLQSSPECPLGTEHGSDARFAQASEKRHEKHLKGVLLSTCWSWQFCCFERQQISGKGGNSHS